MSVYYRRAQSDDHQFLTCTPDELSLRPVSLVNETSQFVKGLRSIFFLITDLSETRFAHTAALQQRTHTRRFEVRTVYIRYGSGNVSRKFADKTRNRCSQPALVYGSRWIPQRNTPTPRETRGFVSRRFAVDITVYVRFSTTFESYRAQSPLRYRQHNKCSQCGNLQQSVYFASLFSN